MPWILLQPPRWSEPTGWKPLFLIYFNKPSCHCGLVRRTFGYTFYNKTGTFKNEFSQIFVLHINRCLIPGTLHTQPLGWRLGVSITAPIHLAVSHMSVGPMITRTATLSASPRSTIWTAFPNNGSVSCQKEIGGAVNTRLQNVGGVGAFLGRISRAFCRQSH